MTQIDLLAALTPDQRRELYDRLGYEFRDTALVHSPEELELWDAINDSVGLGRRARPPFSTFVTSYGKRRFAMCVALMDDLLDEALAPMTRRPVKHAVRLMLLKCLCDNIRARNLLVSATMLCNNFSILRAVVDQNFPGYIEAKLLHRVAPMAVKAA